MAEKKYSKNGAAVKCFGPSYFVTALAASRQDPLSFTMRGCIKGVFRQLNKLGEIVEEVGTHVSFSVDKRGPHSVFFNSGFFKHLNFILWLNFSTHPSLA